MDTSVPPVHNDPGMDQAPLPETPKKQYGPLIGIVIIVGLLAVGGLYLWGMQLMQDETMTPQSQSDQVTEDLQTYSTSDDLGSIEADLEATSIDNIDSGASEVEGELQVQ